SFLGFLSAFSFSALWPGAACSRKTPIARQTANRHPNALQECRGGVNRKKFLSIYKLCFSPDYTLGGAPPLHQVTNVPAAGKTTQIDCRASGSGGRHIRNLVQW